MHPFSQKFENSSALIRLCTIQQEKVSGDVLVRKQVFYNPVTPCNAL